MSRCEDQWNTHLLVTVDHFSNTKIDKDGLSILLKKVAEETLDEPDMENPLTCVDLQPFQHDAAREAFKTKLKAHDVRFQPTSKNGAKMAVCTLCGKNLRVNSSKVKCISPWTA